MTSTINPKVLQILNLVAVLGTVVFNALVNIIPLNGVSTGAVSDSYPNLFTPPGYVFAIWGVIYVLIITFAFYQVRASQREEQYLQDIGLLYVFGAIANIVWLILFHYSYGAPEILLLTPIPIILLLVILLYTYVRLGIGVKPVPRNQKLAVHLPISVYAGWISLATIANIASFLNVVVPGIPYATQELWTSAVILIALLITLLMIVLRRDFAFPLVVIWAAIGIATKQAASALIFWTAIASVIGIVVALLIVPLLVKETHVRYYAGTSD